MKINENELLEKIQKDYPFLLSTIISVVGKQTFKEIMTNYIATIDFAEKIEQSQDI